MNIAVSQAQGNVPVTVIKLDGQLDGQNYQELISKSQELYKAGAHDFVGSYCCHATCDKIAPNRKQNQLPGSVIVVVTPEQSLRTFVG